MQQKQGAPERVARDPLILRLDSLRRQVMRVIELWERTGVACVV